MPFPGASGGDANVQSDWTQTDNANDAYIENKPNLSGGTDTQIIAKDSATDYDFTWVDHRGVTTGGTDGQVLTATGTAYGWEDATAGTGAVDSVTGGTGITSSPTTGAVTVSITAEGVGTTELATDGVTSAKIDDGTITNDDIANGTIAEGKLDVDNTPSNDYVLSWDGTRSTLEWVAQDGVSGVATDTTITSVFTGGVTFTDDDTLYLPTSSWPWDEDAWYMVNFGPGVTFELNFGDYHWVWSEYVRALTAATDDTAQTGSNSVTVEAKEGKEYFLGRTSSNQALIGATDAATGDITAMQVYKVLLGGTFVDANPGGTSLTALTTVTIGDTDYSISNGSGTITAVTGGTGITATTTSGSVDVSITSEGVTTALLADDGVTLGKMAMGTQGEYIGYDSSGDPVAVTFPTIPSASTATPRGRRHGGCGHWRWFRSWRPYPRRRR